MMDDLEELPQIQIPEDKPKRKSGRPRSPDWAGLHAVERYLLKLDMLTRKMKKVPPGIMQCLVMEGEALGVLYPGWNRRRRPLGGKGIDFESDAPEPVKKPKLKFDEDL
jgi:hypothetical protein